MSFPSRGEPNDALAGFRSRFVLVNYNEIALKGRNRSFFENALVKALRKGLQDLHPDRIKRLNGRILVQFPAEISLDPLRRRLGAIHGIANFELAGRTALDLDALEEAVGRAIEPVEVGSFAIRTRRANKKFPLQSVDINCRLGDYVVRRKGWKVRLDEPELEIHVHVLEKHIFFGFGRLPGSGGMPPGVAGKVVCLLSGGIDSPVAAHRMLRRGCTAVFVHFHSAPFTSEASQEKVLDLAERLVEFHLPARLYLVPFAPLQQRIVAGARPPLRVVLYRRFMVRTAEAIARREGARALVTGEALGQVASQTLENLATIDAAAALPILRPLIGMDKLEIVREAQRIGTYTISIEPHDDCCSFLMPAHPATYSGTQELDEAEGGFDVESEVRALLGAAKIVDVETAQTGRLASTTRE